MLPSSTHSFLSFHESDNLLSQEVSTVDHTHLAPSTLPHPTSNLSINTISILTSVHPNPGSHIATKLSFLHSSSPYQGKVHYYPAPSPAAPPRHLFAGCAIVSSCTRLLSTITIPTAVPKALPLLSPCIQQYFSLQQVSN